MEPASESGGGPPSQERAATEKKGKKEKRKDSLLGDFEPPEERAKRIRKERKAIKEKDVEEEKKRQMTKAIGSVLNLNPSKVGASKLDKAPSVGPGPAGPSFQSFGVGPALPQGPTVAAGPGRPDNAVVAAGPSPSSLPGPALPGANSEVASASMCPMPRPRGPMRPSAADLAKPADDPEEEDPMACPEGHTLKAFRTPDKGWKCSVCEEEVERDAALWGCRRCMFDVCAKCQDIRKAKANYVPPVIAEKSFAETRPMDHLNAKTRVSWDELKDRLEKSENLREEGVPGAKSFDDFAAKLEVDRTQRLSGQEDETKEALRHVNSKPDKKAKKEKKVKKEKVKSKGPKRTADGALLADSSADESSEEKDALLARYKK